MFPVKLLGIHGPLNGGKDTITNYLTSNFYVRKYAFADPIKESLKAIFGFSDLEMSDRIQKEKVNDFWGISPRYAAQKLGTEFGRNLIHKDIWIKKAEQVLNQSEVPLIISDVRYDNEADWIRSLGGKILHIKIDIDKDEKYNHTSEGGIQFKEGDFTIENDKSKGLSELYKNIEKVLQEMK